MFSIRKSSTELNKASELRWQFPSALSPEAHAEWGLYKILEHMGLHEILPSGSGRNRSKLRKDIEEYVLKSMGLSQKLENVDELMLDMSESHDDMRSIQAGLGASHATDIEDDDLEKELEMLFADENILFVPSHSNSMGAVVKPAPAAVEPAVAAVEPAVAAEEAVPEAAPLAEDGAPPPAQETAPPELAERPAAT